MEMSETGYPTETLFTIVLTHNNRIHNGEAVFANSTGVQSVSANTNPHLVGYMIYFMTNVILWFSLNRWHIHLSCQLYILEELSTHHTQALGLCPSLTADARGAPQP